ncbi:MAG TPA: hypothetical protein VMB66_10415 [Candidatus Acidoferrales bacterium]|nr:hypothetical protein [Candidatus Acidoferrales bacterium]
MRSRLLLIAFLAFSCAAVAQQESNSSGSPAPPAVNHPATNAPTPAPNLTPGPDGKLSQQQMQELFRIVADKDLENEKRERDYTYVDREVQNKLDGNGDTKSTEERTYDVLQIAGEEVRRLTAKDDKPLDAKEAAKEDEKIQKIIDKRKNESDSDRRKREEKEEKEREDGRKFVKEIADAYNFTLVGTEMVSGRPAWVIDGEPRPGFEPHMKDAKFLTKFHGRVWIDQGDLQLAKMDVEAIDTVSIGLFLARIHKGTRVMLEQTRVNDEVWLPKHVTFKLDARIALLKGYKMDGDDIYSDYKKFRTSSKIVGMGELPEDKDFTKQK